MTDDQAELGEKGNGMVRWAVGARDLGYPGKVDGNANNGTRRRERRAVGKMTEATAAGCPVVACAGCDHLAAA